MDILSAHRDGLIEQLDEEVAALAGRGRDHAQRAVVLHHLHDHSRGNYGWALAEARRTLRIASGLANLRHRLDRWGWLYRRRDEVRAALERLAETLGDAGRNRTAAAYRAYRLSSSRALRVEAEASLDLELLDLLEQCHAARRSGEAMPFEVQQSLAGASESLAAAAVDRKALERAWLAIEATGLRRAARRLLSDKSLDRRAARDVRRGAIRTERELRADAVLPPSFKANPAQHFYVLQQSLRERHHQQWREACDREPDAFELAA
ncbi:hypothetical protein [Sphingomonas sp.]|uniref:hypothetical protein n=1 Tax=Sphingomonas sp. TaxID=28214 RepID=UPI0025FD848E|nr:hypothetical protein [Sphingomonas sp.]